MTSIVSEVLWCRSPLWYLPSSPYARRYADEMSNSRRSPSLRSISVDEDQPCWWSHTDFFIASHWRERSSCWFTVTLLVFVRADHSTSQVLTTVYVVFISTFYWRLASLTKELTKSLEDIQRRALQVIIGNIPYEEACGKLNLIYLGWLIDVIACVEHCSNR